MTLSWNFPGKALDIRLGSPDGKLWGSVASSGSAQTGRWVTDGMTFFVQDRQGEAPASPNSTLGFVVVHLTDQGCHPPGQGPS